MTESTATDAVFRAYHGCAEGLRIRQYGKYAVEAPGSVLEDRYYMVSDSKLQFIALMG